MEEIIFETKNLSFNSIITYPDVKISKNKVTFIEGESGTGKTTLLKLFNGTLPQSSGEIFYNGKNIQDIDTILLRKEVLLISQGVFLFDTTIKENFVQFYEYCRREIPNDDQITKFLQLCCAHFSIDKDCTTMSGGERQRVYMAIYLSFQPKVVMLDEPTSALDSKNSNNVIKNIICFCKKNDITVIVVTHDKEITEKFAENIITVKNGGGK